MTKKYVKSFMALLISGLVLIGVFVYLVDPFYHYHAPLFGMEPYLYSTVYQTPGVARNLDYDSVILGSSMTENFRTSWFDDELGWKTVKLSYSGARTDDLSAIMEQIFADNREVKNVFIDINDYQLSEDYTSSFAKRPDYLYDDNLFNDVKYILNKDVIMASLGRVAALISGVPGNMDLAYCWEGAELFGTDKVRKEFDSIMYSNNSSDIQMQEPSQESIDNCIKNMENITKYIEDNPDTHFYVFYPPYSMAYWQTLKELGRLNEKLTLFEKSMECLMKYENVSVYYFQDEKEYITNLGNYRDLCHYTPEMNRYIFECVRDGSHVIDVNNYQEKVDEMSRFADSFDYESLW